jgi:hypothetical protein
MGERPRRPLPLLPLHAQKRRMQRTIHPGKTCDRRKCLEILKPLAISPEQANHLRRLIDAETKKEGNAAGKQQTDKSPQEISQVVHKVGTNRLLSRKTVTFSFSEPYDFVPSLLASIEASPSPTPSSLGDENSEILSGAALSRRSNPFYPKIRP